MEVHRGGKVLQRITVHDPPIIQNIVPRFDLRKRRLGHPDPLPRLFALRQILMLQLFDNIAGHPLHPPLHRPPPPLIDLLQRQQYIILLIQYPTATPFLEVAHLHPQPRHTQMEDVLVYESLDLEGGVLREDVGGGGGGGEQFEELVDYVGVYLEVVRDVQVADLLQQGFLEEVQVLVRVDGGFGVALENALGDLVSPFEDGLVHEECGGELWGVLDVVGGVRIIQ